MKTSLFFRGLAPLAASVLLLPMAARAQTTSITITGFVNGLLSPGVIVTNAASQVLLRGTTDTWAAVGSDARITGQVLNILGGGAYNADGTANLQGVGYEQVGTWDPAHTNFTPTAGMWDVAWRGVLQTDNSILGSFAGYGVGGTIDGLRLEGTWTRGPACCPIDPAVPYILTGTIKPPPVSTTLVFNDFNGGVTGLSPLYACGAVSAFATNQALGLRASFSDCGPNTLGNWASVHLCVSGGWSLADRQTLECQGDLVRISENSTDVAYLMVGGNQGEYFFFLGQNAVGLHKWTPANPNNLTCFWADNTVQLPSTNVVLYLAVTRSQSSAILTARVLDKANQNTVLFQRSFVDTPGVDASLTTAQFNALFGNTMITLVPDPGPPVLAGLTWWPCNGGGGAVGVNQYIRGSQPPVEAVFDNFSLRLHDVPPLSIAHAQAVQLAWPAPTGVNYSVEGAPTVDGPWLPIQDLAMPGIQKQTVPVSSPAQFFRLIQAP